MCYGQEELSKGGRDSPWAFRCDERGNPSSFRIDLRLEASERDGRRISATLRTSHLQFTDRLTVRLAVSVP